MSIIAEVLNDVLPIIDKFAPTICSIISGNYGSATSSALSLLSAAFNSDKGNFPQLASNIISDPNVEDKLKELEKSHACWLPYIDTFKGIKKATVNISLEWGDTPK